MATHFRPSSGVYLQACPGQFAWGKVYGFRSSEGEIRRECPVCGCRQVWHPKNKVWIAHEPNPHPGSHNRYLCDLVGWGP